MAVRLALHYIPRSSRIHRWDARTKLFGIVAVTGALFSSKLVIFVVATGGLAALWAKARLPWRLPLQTIRAWSPFLGFLLIVQAVAWETLLNWPQTISQIIPADSLSRAAFSSWRIVLMILWAVLFTATTRTADVQRAVLWVLKPVPYVPARRIAVMVGLSLHLFATLLDDMEEIHRAQRARWGDRSKNPYRRLKTLVLPLFRKALVRVESTALALAARGYREDVPVDTAPWPRAEMLSCLFLCGLLAAIDRGIP